MCPVSEATQVFACSINSLQFSIFFHPSSVTVSSPDRAPRTRYFFLNGLVNNLSLTHLTSSYFISVSLIFFSIFQLPDFNCVSLCLCQTVPFPVSTKWLWPHKTVSHCSYLFGTRLIFPGSTELCVSVCSPHPC